MNYVIVSLDPAHSNLGGGMNTTRISAASEAEAAIKRHHSMMNAPDENEYVVIREAQDGYIQTTAHRVRVTRSAWHAEVLS